MDAPRKIDRDRAARLVMLRGQIEGVESHVRSCMASFSPDVAALAERRLAVLRAELRVYEASALPATDIMGAMARAVHALEADLRTALTPQGTRPHRPVH